MFSCKLSEIFKSTYFIELLLVHDKFIKRHCEQEVSYGQWHNLGGALGAIALPSSKKVSLYEQKKKSLFFLICLTLTSVLLKKKIILIYFISCCERILLRVHFGKNVNKIF